MNIEIQTCDPNCGYELCIFPTESRRKRAQWIMWICKDGSGSLYIGRAESGATETDPINLPANVSRKVFPKKPKKLK
jgi:hypothetical protein